MKKIIRKMICLLLACTLACAFVACENGDEHVQNGIFISEESPYSAETQEYAENTFYALLEHYVKKNAVGGTLTPAMQNTVKTQAKQIQEKTAQDRVDESLYIALLDKLNEQGKGVIDELTARLNAEDQGLEKTKALYLELSAFLGADYVGALFYDLCVYVYEYKYQKTLDDYEQYGYSFLLDDAKAIKAELDIITKEIGEKNFLSVVKNAFAFSQLIVGESLNSEQLSSFTNAEILTFIKGIDVSSIQIQENGWKWILEKGIGENTGADSNYFARLASEMKKNGDLENVKTVMGSVVNLLAFAIENLQESDVFSLREKDFKTIFCATFARFSEREWQAFESICACELNKENYDLIATERFGQAYTDYKSAVQTASLETLKGAVGKVEFYETFKGYVAGIMPALAYGMEL